MNDFNNLISFNSSSSTTGNNLPDFIVWDSLVDISTPSGTSAKVKKKSNMPTSIFFKLMKKKMGVLKDYRYKARMKKLEIAVDSAERNGQIAFSEELMKRLFVMMREAEMWAAGKKIFLEKDIYEQFKNKTKRQVKITALKNYARPIPSDVLAEKDKCDALKLFDSYVVMHCDDANTVKETEKERVTREKDPILFGIVQDSSRLYFVADWEDEFCDLTLDDIVDLLDLPEEEITMSKSIKITPTS